MTATKSWFALGVAASLAIGGTACAQTTTAAGPYYATPSWDQQLPNATRFVTLSNWNNQAVLDRETGLVWQTTLASGDTDYATASRVCMLSVTGGRAGWRLPTIQELVRTLNVAGGLVQGSPFDFLYDYYSQFVLLSSTATIGGSAFYGVPKFQLTPPQPVSASYGRAWCVQSSAPGAASQ